MTITVAIIAYNEQNVLPRLLGDVLVQSFDKTRTEILLVDSASTDETKRVMQEFAQEHGEEYLAVSVLDNPKKIQSAGWNVAFGAFTTDAIIRVDAHAHIPADFVEKNVLALESGVDVSAGKRPCLNEVDTPWTKTLLQVENSLFGASVNKSRRSERKESVKTAFHAAYKREVVEKVGLFNEKLLRTEDNEYHYRVRKAGYEIVYDPDITSYQYCRSSLSRMLKQKYGNGKWTALTLKACPQCLSLFYFVPLAFLCGIILTTVLAFFDWFWIFAVAMWGAYALFAVVNTVASAVGAGFTRYTILMPFLFLLLHLSYGAGSLMGLLKIPFFKTK